MKEHGPINDKKARSESRLLEISHRVVSSSDKHPIFIVNKAWKHLEETGDDLLRDVEFKVLDPETAERLFLGLLHYKGHIVPKREFSENGPLSGVN